MRPITLLTFVPLLLAAPAPIPEPQLLGTLTGLLSGSGNVNLGSLLNVIPAAITSNTQISQLASILTDAIKNGKLSPSDAQTVQKKLFKNVKPMSKPSSISDAMSKAAGSCGISGSSPSPPPPQQNVLQTALSYVLNGLTSPDLTTILNGGVPSYPKSDNPYPKKSFYNRVQGDAPFTVPESQLLAAIYIPPTFTYKKQPVIMAPGTGATGYSTFIPNMGKLLSTTTFADPIYLNVPGFLLGDAQIHAEYVSYALQYAKAITNINPAIVTWSQGSLDTQWALKYWPSTRKIVTDHIAISPDYHGTVIAYLLCPGIALVNGVACTPSLIQQTYDSAFITRLRSSGGDSAYVPVTTVYSGFDQIVQPQVTSTILASGFIKDDRNVGVSNTYLQEACLGQPAGGVYLHEGVLFNPVAYALTIDALTNDGPGRLERVKGECKKVVADGLGLDDIIATEALIPVALLNIVGYSPKVASEPGIMGYATS